MLFRSKLEMFGDPRGEIRKASEDISVARYQLPLGSLDVSERTKAVDLQFKDKLVGIERLKTA